jgi:hypothetical protein
VAPAQGASGAQVPQAAPMVCPPCDCQNE